MNRRQALKSGATLMAGALVLAACGKPAAVPMGSDGKPLPQLYPIKPGDTSKITYNMLDGVNELRAARSLTPMTLDSSLTAAAATHSRDMALQNRPWHFGSDGSSPLVRVQRVGYTGALVGELISETFQTELETLSAWMALPETRALIMDPKALQMGFAWYQESSGKIWWTMVTGAPITSSYVNYGSGMGPTPSQ
jgi:uncharacterized protein YkwD